MSLFENTSCPVCNREFTAGDDIVVCPECGTPHHRECYNYAGKCVNSGLHSSGFTFDRGASAEKRVEESAEKNGNATPIGTFFPVGNPDKNAGVKDEKDNSERPFMPFGAIPELTNKYDEDSDTIDGESVGDVAATIKNNIPRFIGIFKKFENKTKKFSWNWCAFLFGSLYFFYRKMYRYAVSLISFFVMLVMGSEVALIKFAPKTVEILREATTLNPQSNMSEMNEKMLEMQNASDFKNVIIITYAFLGLLFVLRIIEAVLADKFYKATVVSLVKRVRSQIAEGASFSTPMMGPNEVNLTQEQMKRYYLSSKGGVSLFAPVVAFFAVDLLIRMI